eukprot:TRINITY_DN21935_c0_g1_i1.p1 TRINITY_DN21935_c0_g1~~TRINITY_DN21935_c0_g1_i1.p1  ORF type:complete len:556 (+),score=130.37 TRINITY_DN21935_c0_g1_i1:150-1817(+)
MVALPLSPARPAPLPRNMAAPSSSAPILSPSRVSTPGRVSGVSTPGRVSTRPNTPSTVFGAHLQPELPLDAAIETLRRRAARSRAEEQASKKASKLDDYGLAPHLQLKLGLSRCRSRSVGGDSTVSTCVDEHHRHADGAEDSAGSARSSARSSSATAHSAKTAAAPIRQRLASVGSLLCKTSKSPNPIMDSLPRQQSAPDSPQIGGFGRYSKTSPQGPHALRRRASVPWGAVSSMASLSAVRDVTMGRTAKSHSGSMKNSARTHSQSSSRRTSDPCLLTGFNQGTVLLPGHRGARTRPLATTSPGYLSPAKSSDKESDSEEEAHKQEKPCSIQSLARELGMPVDDTKEACEIFMKYCHVKPEEVMDSEMSREQFEEVLCVMTDEKCVDDIGPTFVEGCFRTADKDDNKSIDIREFCLWFSSHHFTVSLSVPKETRELRELARRKGMSNVDIDRYKEAFDKFDVDHSGHIDYEEFVKALTKLLKIPKGSELPEERCKTLWMRADRDGSGEIDFEEFMAFWTIYFADYDPYTGEVEFDPICDYYKSVRRMPHLEDHH